MSVNSSSWQIARAAPEGLELSRRVRQGKRKGWPWCLLKLGRCCGPALGQLVQWDGFNSSMVRRDGREESERFLSWDSVSDFKCWWLNLPAQCIYSLITLSATIGCMCLALCHVQDDNPFFCKGKWAWEEQQLKDATYCCVLGADISTNLAPTKL